MSRVKVVVANPWGERLGGAENHLRTLLRHVDRDRVDATVVFLSGGSFADEIAALGFRTNVVPTTRLRYGGRAVLATRALRSLLRRESPDVILSWGPKPQIYLGPVAASAGLASRNVWLLTETPSHPIHRLAARLPAAAVMCPSNFIRARLEAVVPRRRAFVVHSGIELRPPPNRAAVAALRERLGLPEGQIVLGMVARLTRVKGQHRLLHALTELRQRGVDVHALLVGGVAHGLDPAYERELRRLVAELGLENAITFTGHVPDVHEYLGLMDLFVSASTEDGFPMAPLEAMAQGIPVVAADAGGPREAIEHGRSGLLVKNGEPDVLADAIERLARDAELRRRLGHAARARVVERFTADRMAEQLTERLEEVVRGNWR